MSGPARDQGVQRFENGHASMREVGFGAVFPEASDDAIISLSKVANRFVTTAGTVVALGSVSLSVQAAQLVVVLGPSGSGKTTLLNMIGALDTPTEGVIDVAGRRVTDLSRTQLFAFRRNTVLRWILDSVFPAAVPELAILDSVRVSSYLLTVVIGLGAAVSAPASITRRLAR